MSKWYVEWKTYINGRLIACYKGGIEAKDGKEAIEYIREHVGMGAHGFHVWHDDDEE